MALPLLKRASEDGITFVVTPGRRPAAGPAPVAREDLMPSRPPGPGEQYRFHADMRRCIGCKCCVVACNEQNGNPASINWRRVGEIEGGWYPHTTRSYLSMGCNHCIDPTCLAGCPVGAYTKDPATGIVIHSADACIGCQYCTWNCSYGVPQYNPERGVVGKCDLCHGRLKLGQAPACVSACPTGAIQVEIVSVDAWRAASATAPAGSGMPRGDGSVAATRVTLPADLPPDARPVDLVTRRAAEAHWPLVVMTVLTQLSVGAFTTIWLLNVLGSSKHLGAAALTSLVVAAIALGASTLHLGRPAYAYRALKMWKRSWLSREVLLFAGFSGVAAIYAGALWFAVPGAGAVGGLTVLLGISGVTASACIYRVPSRPSWNTPLTFAQFQLSSAVLGPLFGGALGTGDGRWLALVAAGTAGASLAVTALRFLRLTASDSVERRATARLLATALAPPFLARGALLAAGGIAVPLFTRAPAALWLALLLALAGELVDRYLFFVSAVPRHMTAGYIGVEAAA